MCLFNVLTEEFPLLMLPSFRCDRVLCSWNWEEKGEFVMVNIDIQHNKVRLTRTGAHFNVLGFTLCLLWG